MAQFGRPQRRDFIRRKFAEWRPLSRGDAWKYVYRLLAWLDDHNGLLHIYDSHKVRDRSNIWFVRARIATELVCREFAVGYPEISDELDLLFKEFLTAGEPIEPLPPAPEREKKVIGELFDDPRTPDDLARYAELRSVLGDVLEQHALPREVAGPLGYAAASYRISQRARQNMLGEGFEDIIGLLIDHFSPPPCGDVFIGQRLETVDGFGERPASWPSGRHIPRPDAAVSNGSSRHVYIVTKKWSLRHDREGTFREELEAYDQFVLPGWSYRFVALTNDFDLGRIHRLAMFARPNGQPLFETVFHVAPQLLMGVHRPTSSSRGSLDEVEDHLRAHRLKSLTDLFTELDEHNARGC